MLLKPLTNALSPRMFSSVLGPKESSRQNNHEPRKAPGQKNQAAWQEVITCYKFHTLSRSIGNMIKPNQYCHALPGDLKKVNWVPLCKTEL
jgi:hypothetical protein